MRVLVVRQGEASRSIFEHDCVQRCVQMICGFHCANMLCFLPLVDTEGDPSFDILFDAIQNEALSKLDFILLGNV